MPTNSEVVSSNPARSYFFCGKNRHRLATSQPISCEQTIRKFERTHAGGRKSKDGARRGRRAGTLMVTRRRTKEPQISTINYSFRVTRGRRPVLMAERITLWNEAIEGIWKRMVWFEQLNSIKWLTPSVNDMERRKFEMNIYIYTRVIMQ